MRNGWLMDSASMKSILTATRDRFIVFFLMFCRHRGFQPLLKNTCFIECMTIRALNKVPFVSGTLRTYQQMNQRPNAKPQRKVGMYRFLH